MVPPTLKTADGERMRAASIVFERPGRLALRELDLDPPGPDDLVVAVERTGISAGTERLLWTGRMPPFPGLGYPLVPGYEAVGRVIDAGADASDWIGRLVFAPGARCFGPVRGLFGAAAARLVVPAARAAAIPDALAEEGVLLALAATARHALADGPWPSLVIGHGALGRLAARLVLALGGPAPTVWEPDPARRDGAVGYPVLDPADDAQSGHAAILDASGDPRVIDQAAPRLARGGEIVLAGFYAERLSFDFPPVFLREARLRAAAEWTRADLDDVLRLAAAGRLRLDGILSHVGDPARAADAYRIAFEDPRCVKMTLDWRGHA